METRMTRKTKVDHKKWNIRWNDLTKDEQARHNIIANYLVAYCEQNPGKTVTWKEIDAQIPHLYSWIFDSYNNNNWRRKLVWNDDGVKIIATRGR